MSSGGGHASARKLAFWRNTECDCRDDGGSLQTPLDYQTVELDLTNQVVNDVTALNPVEVTAIVAPTAVDEVQDVVRRTNGPISVGGGHFSMGGQTASQGSLHLDMRKLNRVIRFAPIDKTIRVEAGIRWCDIQHFLDPHDLSVRIMQTYANFTVGGSLSVNAHGRYVGLGPLILSVRSIALVLADGSLVEANRETNPEIFFGSIGGYGGLGVIVEAELDLAKNTRLERVMTKVPLHSYPELFRNTVRSAPDVVLHNADLYPPHYSRLLSQTWKVTNAPATVRHRVMRLRRRYLLQRYCLWAMTERPGGKWLREHLLDPLVFCRKAVRWRNYEAGYDVAELEPASRRFMTWVLQEYFVPVDRFLEFARTMAEILRRHRVNVVNVSVRHTNSDPGSMLAWAREECFAFVLYHKQRTRVNAQNRVAVWTRELIDAAISCGGNWYLPYQAHATPGQFHRGYPRAKELFALKRKLDPEFRFRNVIWDTYYAPTLREETLMGADAGVTGKAGSEFHQIFGDVVSSDKFYRFLQNVFHLYPEDRFHTLIQESCKLHATDEAIYRDLLDKLPDITPFLASLLYALPSLAKQKAEMARQTRELVGDRKINGYVEIGTTGRYVKSLRQSLRLNGPVVLVNDLAPGMSPVDIVERGRVGTVGLFVPLRGYAPIDPREVPDATADLVTCYVGLHHAEPNDRVDPFLRSIGRVLRSGGLFVLRDHDVTTPAMDAFVSLAHTVFNVGLRVPWETNAKEPRHFLPIADWVRRVETAGLQASDKRLYQAHDPTDNVLMAFIRP